MSATFIISFDCEGKWGVADHLDDFLRANLTNTNLNLAYEKIIALLERWDIKATFAFVGAFTMSIDEYYAKQEWFSDVLVNGKSWLLPFRQEAASQNFDGWFNPRPFEKVTQSGRHEIASHGFTHVPLEKDFITRDDFFREMNALKDTNSFSSIKEMTFVYPRNLIGYSDELKKWNYIGYRDRLIPNVYGNSYLGKKINKARWFFNELNLRVGAQPHSQESDLVCIPSGYFLNHRQGFRKKIPISYTVRRWQNLIQDAIQQEKVVHLYSHPHNFITGEGMFDLLEEILKWVNQAQKRNELANLTQKEYAKSFLITTGSEDGNKQARV